MKPVRSLNISDIHLGCRRLFADWMVANLLNLILPLIPQIDLLVIEGDLYDTAVGFADVPAIYIVRFIATLLKACDEHNVTVRVLRGTFSHDRTQCAIIPELYTASKATNDVKYMDKIQLEYIERFDMRVVYIPDNVPYQSSDDVIVAVKDLMATMGWDTVDYAYVHGSFDHTLPAVAARHCKVLFRVEQFDFVTRYVVVGHIHQHSIKGHVINNGSVDRLCHGEEEPKGLVLIDDQVNEAKITFVENTKATRFVTYDISHLDGEESHLTDYIEEQLTLLPLDVQKHIRIIHPRADIRGAVTQYLRNKFPLVRFTHDKGAGVENAEEVETIVDIDDDDAGVAITEEVLPQLLHAHVTAQNKDLSLSDILDLMAMTEQVDGLSR